MSFKKIVTIVGARPQFVKAASVSRALKNNAQIKEVLLHTGQHFDKSMSDIFFEQLSISTPDYNLNINSGAHGSMTAKMMEAIEKVLFKEKPDGVIVYGDTNSTLAGALTGSKLNIPIFHIEAGLRSYNRTMPEEINRVLTDHISALLFCPTKTSLSNLEKEGITDGAHLVGDVMYDATIYALNFIKNNQKIFDQFAFANNKFCLLTVHRAHSTASFENLNAILEYVQNFAQLHELMVIFPVHPRTKNLLSSIHAHSQMIHYIDPIGYFEMQALLSKAEYVLTDSGGLQKEAYFHKVPCITLRDETEWIETIQNGWNKLWTCTDYVSPKVPIEDYGAGDSAEQIVQILEEYLR